MMINIGRNTSWSALGYFLQLTFELSFHLMSLFCFVDGMRLLQAFFFFRGKAKSGVILLNDPKLLFTHILYVHEAVTGKLMGSDKFIEFELDGEGIFLLRLLDEEHHKERNNAGAGVNEELPGFGVMEDGAGNAPEDDQDEGDDESVGTPRGLGDFDGEVFERVYLLW